MDNTIYQCTLCNFEAKGELLCYHLAEDHKKELIEIFGKKKENINIKESTIEKPSILVDDSRRSKDEDSFNNNVNEYGPNPEQPDKKHNILMIGGLLTKLLGILIRVIMTRNSNLEVISLYMLIMPTFSLMMAISQLGFSKGVSKLVSEGRYKSKKILFSILPLSIVINITLHNKKDTIVQLIHINQHNICCIYPKARNITIYRQHIHMIL